MTDYPSTQVTAGDPPAPSLEGVQWFQRVGVDYSEEMKAHGAPKTVSDGSKGGGGRPSIGMVWPH